MQTNMKQTGFTLIELLVVIVIIGILATISVATFSGYFAQARDSERQAAVRNAATVLKTARAVDTITTFNLDATAVANTLSSEGGYAMPTASTTGYTYHYYNDGSDNFAVYTCSEQDNTLIIDGTAAGVSAVTATCAAAGVTAGTEATTIAITGS